MFLSGRLVAVLYLFVPLVALHAQDNDGPLNASGVMGERLFLDTRFAEFFFTNSGGNANATLASGDPVMNLTQTIHGPVTGPFTGQSMNCRACHLVDEFNSTLGNRTYSDFTTRSPVPLIGDGRTNTPRNSPTLVNILLPHATPLFLHLDGQFANTHDLIIGTLTGRNYGWKPTEYATAISHIAHIIREDDGSGALAQSKFGGGYSYAQVISPNSDFPITKIYRLNYQYTLGDVTITDPTDPNYVTDEEIVDDIAALMLAYLETLFFAQDLDGNFTGSPYDQFLIKNSLPQQPDPGETPPQYSQRLLDQINQLASPQFVTDPADGQFTTQNQTFQFGQQELDGLKIFFARGGGPPGGGKTGNCVACHAPPDFTDFVFHNTGASQEEYDSIHGPGTFSQLPVPNLAQRQTNYDAWLPQTTNHPNATGIFETPPTPQDPAAADLGLWNVFANPDFPAPQAGLQQVFAGLLPAPTPQLLGSAMIGGGFAFRATNGAPGWTYNVLETTDLSVPVSEWNIISTNIFDQNGQFNYTNAQAAAAQDFYTLAPAAAPDALALPLTVARFKTPTLRDLGQSEPYLHTGRMSALEDVLQFYQNFSDLSRAAMVRNGDPALNGISLDSNAVTALAAFLRALNEDYTD